MCKLMQQRKAVHQGYLRVSTVLAKIPVSRRTWLEGVRSGIYPKPVHLSARVVGWRVSDIEELCAQIDAGGVK